eukprot:gene33225-42963_t
MKVSLAQKNHEPQCAPKYDQLKASILSDYVPISTTLIDDNGKKRFDTRYSDTEQFKPSCKLISHKESDEQYNPRGKKYIPGQPYCAREIENQKKRYIESEATRRSETATLPTVEWTTKKTVLMSDGNPAYKKESKDFDMESYMCQKQRIKSELQQRNYIGTATPGDKAYYEADREPGFYAKGGLVTGSTISVKKSGKPTLKKNESNSNKSLGVKLGETYEEKVKKKEKKHDVDEVKYLTIATEEAGEAVPSWEEKTGMFLIRPEDEKY